jgi:hypothetical protein
MNEKMEVKHRCGHVQVITSFDHPRYKPELFAKLGKTKEQWVKEMIEWYESVPCPGCYVPRLQTSVCIDCGTPTQPGPGSARCKACWDDRCGYDNSGPAMNGVCC